MSCVTHLPPDTTLIQRLAGFARLHDLLAGVPEPDRAQALAALPLPEVQACFGGEALEHITLIQSRLSGQDYQGAFEREAYLCLCEGEARMVVHELQHPSRRIGQLHFSHYIHVRQYPVSLAGLLASEQGCQRLVGRLSKMVAYTAEHWAQADAVVFWIDGGKVRQLLFQQDSLLPAANPQRDLPIDLRWGEPMVVWNSLGLGGVMAADGAFPVPCQYAYLSGPYGGLVEASLQPLPPVQPPVAPDDFLGYRCQMIDCTSGQTVNPSGHPALQGSLDLSDGVFVALVDGSAARPLMGFMNRQGKWLGQPRWADVRLFWHRMAAVQCPLTRLWGFVDPHGEVVIEPILAQAGVFNYGLAIVRLASDPAHEVLIDQQGHPLSAPWNNLDTGPNDTLVAQDDDGQWALLDSQGQTLFGPTTVPADLDDEHKAAHLYRSHLAGRKAKAQALIQANLQTSGPLDELAKAVQVRSGRDLRELGLWMRRVKVERAALPEFWQSQIDPAQPAHIGWAYPVTESTFNLEMEVPVVFIRHDGQEVSLGVAWRDVQLEAEPSSGQKVG